MVVKFKSKEIKRKSRRIANAIEIEGLQCWYEVQKHPAAPDWNRIWAIARAVRDNHTSEPRVCDGELPRLVCEVAEYCFRTFDPTRCKQEKSLEHNFIQLFERKLWSKINNSRRRRKIELMLREVTSDICEERADGRKAALSACVQLALTGLSPQDQEIIRLIYWENRSLTQVSAHLGIGKTTAWERHNRALMAFRVNFERDYWPYSSQMLQLNRICPLFH